MSLTCVIVCLFIYTIWDIWISSHRRTFQRHPAEGCNLISLSIPLYREQTAKKYSGTFPYGLSGINKLKKMQFLPGFENAGTQLVLYLDKVKLTIWV